jgi:hypothetical protein
MPRTNTRKKMIGFKAGDSMIDDVDERARAEGLFSRRGVPARSEMLRLAVLYLDHMPAGWRPDGWKPAEPLAECRPPSHSFARDAHPGDTCLCGEARTKENPR